MSNSARSHRWQPTRLPRPWDSPGKKLGLTSQQEHRTVATVLGCWSAGFKLLCLLGICNTARICAKFFLGFLFFFRHGVQDVVSCFPNQGSSPGPLHWKHLLGSPLSAFSILVNLHKNPDIGTDILLLLFSCKVVSDSL